MPVYEYKCQSCGHELERFVKSVHMQEAPACPQCGKASMRRLISRAMYIQDEKTKMDQLDPKYEKMMDEADKPFRADDPLKRITGQSLYPD